MTFPALALLAPATSHPGDAHDHFVLGLELIVRSLVGQPVVGPELDDAVARINDGVPMVVALGLAARAGALESDAEGERHGGQTRGGDRPPRHYRKSVHGRDDPGRTPEPPHRQPGTHGFTLEGFIQIVAAWRVNGDTVRERHGSPHHAAHPSR